MTTTDHGPSPHGGMPGGGMYGGMPGGRGVGAPGPRPAAAPVGDRLPHAPRERKPALAALAVLLILGGALVSTSLVLSSGDTVSAIALARDVPPGQKIAREDLREVKIAEHGGLAYVAWSPGNLTRVTNVYARVTLVKGSLLHSGQTVKDSFLDAGKVAVGLSLKPSQYPSELGKGDLVSVYLTAAQSSSSQSSSSQSGAGQSGAAGRPLVEQARVFSIVSGSGDKKRLQSGGETMVTIVVDEKDASAVAPAASKGDVALVQLPPTGQ